MFALSGTPVDTAEWLARIGDPRAGGVSVFEGRVRNHNEGRPVASLEYEAYAQMAESQGARIIEEALDRFDILHAACVHRTGHLELEDVAVWIGVSAAHRAAAFDATRYIIDEIKQRLPVWKKEHYEDGDAEWVLCTECARQRSGNAP